MIKANLNFVEANVNQLRKTQLKKKIGSMINKKVMDVLK